MVTYSLLLTRGGGKEKLFYFNTFAPQILCYFIQLIFSHGMKTAVLQAVGVLFSSFVGHVIYYKWLKKPVSQPQLQPQTQSSPAASVSSYTCDRLEIARSLYPELPLALLQEIFSFHTRETLSAQLSCSWDGGNFEGYRSRFLCPVISCGQHIDFYAALTMTEARRTRFIPPIIQDHIDQHQRNDGILIQTYNLNGERMFPAA